MAGRKWRGEAGGVVLHIVRHGDFGLNSGSRVWALLSYAPAMVGCPCPRGDDFQGSSRAGPLRQ
jgi:hypothetical protein